VRREAELRRLVLDLFQVGDGVAGHGPILATGSPAPLPS
jgi:hypothetical protein